MPERVPTHPLRSPGGPYATVVTELDSPELLQYCPFRDASRTVPSGFGVVRTAEAQQDIQVALAALVRVPARSRRIRPQPSGDTKLQRVGLQVQSTSAVTRPIGLG